MIPFVHYRRVPMYSGQTVFKQLLQHLPRYEFNLCVSRYSGEYWAKKFSTYDQFLCLAYAQMSGRESLRDIETCLNSHQEKLYHIGFRGNVSRTTLADANERRDWRIELLSNRSPPTTQFLVAGGFLRFTR